jgi:hypothetical protein
MPDENDLREAFLRAEPWEKYLSRNAQSQEGFLQVYHGIDPDPDIVDFLLGKGPLKVLALGETWCPDVIHHFPLLRRLEERVESLEVRFRSSDSEKPLMEVLNPDKKNTIPTIVFLDPDFKEEGRIKGRKPMAKEYMLGRLAGRRNVDVPKHEVAVILRDFNAQFAASFVQETYSEIRANLTKQCLI